MGYVAEPEDVAGVVAFLAFVLALAGPGAREDIDPRLVSAAPYIALAMGLHLAIDIIIGTAAQRAGRLNESSQRTEVVTTP